jgi:hypothetical protein
MSNLPEKFNQATATDAEIDALINAFFDAYNSAPLDPTRYYVFCLAWLDHQTSIPHIMENCITYFEECFQYGHVYVRRTRDGRKYLCNEELSKLGYVQPTRPTRPTHTTRTTLPNPKARPTYTTRKP